MISVLYVDDEPELLELCRLFLEQTGNFRVETINEPQEVLRLLENNTYDAVICDYQMPDIDGISLLKEIRKIHGDIPFILFTGRGREEIVIDALNNGADFYLQKGGDVKAQFAELASKVRQAVLRHQAQHSLRESEKLLFDIINFLPDATFAINRESVVIAWNRAIENMTGIPASQIVGKNNYEYALPFYDRRRPLLIDLIFESDEKIKTDYSGIVRENDVLVAETNLPRPRGEVRILSGRASPLYNQNGEITGAIESIRDITDMRHADDELRAAHEQLTASDEELRSQYEEVVRAEIEIRAREEQLKEITSTIPGIVFQFYARPGGIYGMYYVSERSRDIIGIDPVPDTFLDHIKKNAHPEDLEKFEASIDISVDQSAPWFYEGRFIKPTGETIWLKGISSPAVHGNELVYSGVLLDITERKKSETALLEEEEKYRTLIEHSQDAVFIVQDEKLVFFNKALTDMTGFQEEDLIGRSIGGLIAPEDRERVVTSNCQRMEGNPVPDSYEFAVLHSDGTTRVRIRMNAGIATYRGKPATIGTFHNISEDENREVALQKSEQKYRELVEHLPQIIFETDENLKITFANQAALNTFGFTHEDLERGISAFDYTDTSQHDIIWENLKKISKSTLSVNPEYNVKRKDGSRFPAYIYATPIIHDGNITGYRGIIVDISEWKTASQAMREIEDRYSSLAEAAEDLIYIIDRNDMVVYVNSYAEKILNKNREEIVGRPRRNLFPEPATARQYMNLQRVFSTGMPLRIESVIPLPEGDTWQDTHLVPLKAADGTITAVMGISRDITQIKQAELALKRSNEKLNLLNSITRHDVANQLTILSGYIQLAQMKEPDTVITDFLKKIQAASETIQRQIDFTRAYQDLGIRAPDWFSLDEIVISTKPAGIVFTHICRNIEIFADPMLEKVFFNLFDNAIRHGEHVTSITVRCEIGDEGLLIVVEDDGVGISLDTKQKIFQKGYGKNTGYGLFLVQEILAITGISIHETGRQGSGARFEISVPRNGYRRTDPPARSS